MSMDWSLEIDACPTCGATPEGPLLNCTRNLNDMQVLAGVYDALRANGTRAGDHLRVLENGVEHCMANFADYEALNPENGWGSAAGFLEFLAAVVGVTRKYPDAKIYVST